MNPPLSLFDLIDGETRKSKSAKISDEAEGEQEIRWEEVEQSGTPWRKKRSRQNSSDGDTEVTTSLRYKEEPNYFLPLK